MKRAHRDPYGGWWDAQEKRNFGEPVHEDNEILSVFSPEQYTHVSPGKGFFVILRLYNPLQSFFDKTWRPSEIEPI